MATVGAVVVKLEANAAQFNKAMTDAAAKTQQLSQSLGKMGKALTIGVTAPIGIATAALGGMILSTMAAADQMLLMSQKSGITTKTLQELKYAGDLAGVSVETIATSSAMLTRNLVDAANGIGEAKDTVAMLGLTLRDTNGAMLDQETLLLGTLDALMQMKNPTEQAAAAMELFGRGGKEMLPLLKTFTGGLEEVQAEAAKLGIIMSTDTIMAFDLLDDVLSVKLPGAFRGATNAIMKKFLPVLTNQLIPFIENSMIPAILKVGDVVGTLAGWFARLSPTLKVALVAFTGLAAAIGPVLIGVAALIPLMTILSKVVLPAVGKQLLAIWGTIAGITLPIWLVIAAVAAMGVAWAYFSKDIIDGVGNAIDWVAGKLNWAIDIINEWDRRFGDGTRQMARFADGADSAGDRFKASMTGMDDSIRSTISGIITMSDISMPALGEAVDTAAGKVKKLGKALEIKELPKIKLTEIFEDDEAMEEHFMAKVVNIGETMKKIPKTKQFFIPPEYVPELTAIESAWVDIGSTIGGVIKRTDLSFSSLKSSVSSVVSAVQGFVKELMKIAAKKVLLGILNSLTGGGFSAGTGLLGGAKKWLGFAHGGIISEPTAMVGMRSGSLGIMAERGPEAIVPLGGRRGGGGVALTVNVFGSVGVDDIGEQIIGTLRREGMA
jgi:hypothetical protein